MKYKLLPLVLILVSSLGFAQNQKALMVSPVNDDAVISYFQQCPESPDGKKIAFTIFCTPDSMELVVKNRADGKLRSIAKVKGQHRHSGTHPVWASNDILIYGSTTEYEVYQHNIKTGEVKKFRGGQISDYSPLNNKVLLTNKNAAFDKVGIYALDLTAGYSKCIISRNDVAPFKNEMGTKNDVKHWRLDHPYWSPDGKKINFQIKTYPNKSRSDHDYIFYSGEQLAKIHFIGKKPMHVQWWDNHSVFGHDWFDKKDYHMRRYDLQGNVLEEIAGYGCHGAVSPDRKWIVTESWYNSDPIKVQLYKKGETEATKILFEQAAVVNGKKFWEIRSHIHPAFSRDGQRVYFNAQGSDGKSKVWCYDLSEIVSNN